MKYKLLIFSLPLFFVSAIWGQSTKNLFDFDYAQFAYDSSANYIEFYYSLNEGALTVHNINDTNFVEGVLKIDITDTTSRKPAINKEWSLKQPLDESDSTGGKSLIGLLGFVVPKGNYKCSVQLKDKFDESNQKTVLDDINVKPLFEDSLAVSDIQLASRIIQNSENKSSIFYKNTFEITPFPTAVYSTQLPAVFYYFEVYDHEKTKSDKPYQLNTVVTNSRGQIVYDKIQSISRHIASRAEVGVLPIIKYPTDIYSLRVAILDSLNNYGMGSTKKFYVYNPSIKNADSSNTLGSKLVTSAFGILSNEECDDLFAKCKYIATNPEKQQYNKLTTLNGKRQFLFDFWKKRDSDPNSDMNMTYQEFLNRVAESNRKYGSSMRVGWKTDRGRVLIMYGEPSEVDRYPNQDNTKPYEIWRYNDIEGGVEFIFADLTGFNDYELISSTKRGEIQDSNWQSRISANQ